MKEWTSTELLRRLRDNDPEAATLLVDRYIGRLIDLARSRLSPKLSRRVDAEDVVQSACRSFFRLARDGHYQLDADEDLWHLLAAITVNKVRKTARRHTSQKRSVANEESAAVSVMLDAVHLEALAQEPSPEEAAMMLEETDAMMRALTPLQRQILELRLQGHTVTQTGEKAQCAERTVHRALELARKYLLDRLNRN